MEGDQGTADLEMQTFLLVLRRNIAFALAVGLLIAGGAYYGSGYLQPQYEAVATVNLAPSRASGNAAGLTFVAPAMDANAYALVIESPNTIAFALDQTGISPSDEAAVQEASSSISTSVLRGEDSNLLTITVVRDDPREAAALANALARYLIQWDRARASEALEAAIIGLQTALTAQQVSGPGELTDAILAEQNARYLSLLSMRGAVTSTVQVVTPALPPLEPAEPRPLMNAIIAFVTSTICVLAIGVIVPVLSGRLRSARESAELLGLPLLGEFRRARAPRLRAESVRHVAAYAATYLSSVAGEPGRLLAVTSPRPSDQASAFSLGLAVAFADQGKRTLFIDTDLRNPVSFGMPTGTGTTPDILGAALRGAEVPLPMTLKRGLTELDVISASFEADDATVLLAKGLTRLLSVVALNYDVVVLNTTPVLVAADALSFIGACDGSVMVIDDSVTSRQDAKAAVDLIRRKGGNPLGIVFAGRHAASPRRHSKQRRRRTRAAWVLAPEGSELKRWDLATDQGNKPTQAPDGPSSTRSTSGTYLTKV